MKNALRIIAAAKGRSETDIKRLSALHKDALAIGEDSEASIEDSRWASAIKVAFDARITEVETQQGSDTRSGG